MSTLLDSPERQVKTNIEQDSAIMTTQSPDKGNTSDIPNDQPLQKREVVIQTPEDSAIGLTQTSEGKTDGNDSLSNQQSPENTTGNSIASPNKAPEMSSTMIKHPEKCVDRSADTTDIDNMKTGTQVQTQTVNLSQKTNSTKTVSNDTINQGTICQNIDPPALTPSQMADPATQFAFAEYVQKWNALCAHTYNLQTQNLESQVNNQPKKDSNTASTPNKIYHEQSTAEQGAIPKKKSADFTKKSKKVHKKAKTNGYESDNEFYKDRYNYKSAESRAFLSQESKDFESDSSISCSVSLEDDNWDDILDNISLNSGKKSATSYETLDNF